MNPSFTFVTSNDHKVMTATAVCQKYGVAFERKNLDLTEIQADNGEVIALGKVRQAYEACQSPVAITDDSWLVYGLNGFPGPYMKYINQWFTPDDFLRLTKDLKDRRITLRHIIVYKDASEEKVFSVDIDGVLLAEVRGSSVIPHFALVSFDGGKRSVAEAEAADDAAALVNHPNAWDQLCEWLESRD